METQSNVNSGKHTQTNGHINIENRGGIIVAHIDGGQR